MKRVLLLALFAISASAFSNTISCKLEDANNSSNYEVTTQSVDQLLNGEIIEAYDNGIDIGENNYSYIGELYDNEDGTYDLNLTFQENNNLQDEVGQMAWGIKEADLKKPGVLLVEPITDGYPAQTIMVITCEII